MPLVTSRVYVLDRGLFTAWMTSETETVTPIVLVDWIIKEDESAIKCARLSDIHLSVDEENSTVLTLSPHCVS
jgi:hypothetical protein